MGRSDQGYGSVGPILFQTRPKFVKKYPRKVETFLKNQNLGEPENKKVKRERGERKGQKSEKIGRIVLQFRVFSIILHRTI